MRKSFHRRDREWVKTTLSKNQDTLVTLEDDQVLNEVYPTDQLPDFKLGARPQVPRWAAAASANEAKEHEGHDIDIDEFPINKKPPPSALCNNCWVRFDHSQSPSSSSNFRISLLLFSFSSIIYLISSKSYLINNNNFSMASSAFSLPFTLHLLALHTSPRSSFSFISLFMYFITGMFTFMLLFTWDDILYGCFLWWIDS